MRLCFPLFIIILLFCTVQAKVIFDYFIFNYISSHKQSDCHVVRLKMENYLLFIIKNVEISFDS